MRRPRLDGPSHPLKVQNFSLNEIFFDKNDIYFYETKINFGTFFIRISYPIFIPNKSKNFY